MSHLTPHCADWLNKSYVSQVVNEMREVNWWVQTQREGGGGGASRLNGTNSTKPRKLNSELCGRWELRMENSIALTEIFGQIENNLGVLL